jgi:hypothetical protein
MRWFRRHIGLGSRLALFALAVQLALSFAHVHVTDPGRAQAAAASVSGSGDAPIPKSDVPVDPGCAICGLIQLVATATPSAAPALPLLMASGQARLSASDAFLLAAVPRLLFQARAPPAA